MSVSRMVLRITSGLAQRVPLAGSHCVFGYGLDQVGLVGEQADRRTGHDDVRFGELVDNAFDEAQPLTPR